MNAWICDAAKPITSRFMTIIRKLMPMMTEEANTEDEDRGENVHVPVSRELTAKN